jgi:hypothetical protein
MKRFLNEEERLFIEENQIFVPSLESALEELVKRIAPLYKEFISRGKFYDQKHHYEFGRQYVTIFETAGVGEPYKTIGDWAEELTGEEKFNWGWGYTGEIYQDLICEIVREYVDEVLGEFHEEIEESYCFIELELEEEVLGLSIDLLEKAIA